MKRILQIVRRSSLLLLGSQLALQVRGATDLPIDDFRQNGYQHWTATGTAFQSGAARDELLGKLEIENAADLVVASSELDGDDPTGTLTSPEFRIAREYIAFRIGGGDYEQRTCLNLVIGGKVVRSATGWRSDRLAPASWDVREFKGQKARLQIVDDASGDWGHINVGRLLQTDQPERLPVITEPLYQETLRPQFHFTARQWTMSRLNPRPLQEGWINDLNGLIYYDGEYHLFAQRWWKCWLHAVSKDLVHWTELEPAFGEEKNGTGTQSGTCVVDYQNTSGLSPDPAKPPMVAFWARNDNRSQCLSYSLDHGRTWKHYAKNPLMIFPERDPKVFWYAPSKHWVMMLYGDKQYHVLTSTNLLNWTDEHKPIRNSFECPDFFELPLDGNRDARKWVLIQGNGKYSIGTFDGTEFKEEAGRYSCDFGDFYATQSWGNVETGDGRRIQAAWMQPSDFPDMPFNQQISFPCLLTLRSTPKGPRIFREPIREIGLLHRAPDTWSNRTLSARQSLLLEPAGRLFHLQAEVDLPEGSKLTFNVRGVRVILTSQTLECSGRKASTENPVRSVEMLIDRTSIETFLNQGEVSLTKFVLPKESGLSVKAEGGPATLKSLTIWPLNSAWKQGVSD